MQFGLSLKYLLEEINMKYFENLPKISFETTIGEFQISDFFTYIDSSKLDPPDSSITFDDKSTLIEASFQVYEDPDSFWIFVLANNNFNPFLINPINTEIAKKEIEPKLNVTFSGDTAGTTAYVFPKGSIILNQISNSGNSASYSSVGNFDLNGAFTIVDEDFYYSDSMFVKEQKQGTALTSGTTGSNYVVIYPGTGGNYEIQKNLVNTVTQPASSKPAYNFNPKTGKVVLELKFTGGRGSKGDIDKGVEEPKSEGDLEETSEVTFEQLITETPKIIKAYPIDSIGLLKSSFITANYI